MPESFFPAGSAVLLTHFGSLLPRRLVPLALSVAAAIKLYQLTERTTVIIHY